MGFRALRNLRTFTKAHVKGWFTGALVAVVHRIEASYALRNEVITGGIASEGTGIALNNLNATVTAVDCFLKGRRMAQLAALSNVNLLATSGGVAAAIYTSGAAAAALTLNADEQSVFGALIVANTDGAGDAVEDDNGAAKYIVVINGADATGARAASGPPTSAQIEAALAASENVHDGVTGWQVLSTFEWNRDAVSAVTVTFTHNRNNCLDTL